MSTSREDTYRLRILELRALLSGRCSRTMSAMVYAQFQIDEKPIRSACASSYYCRRAAAKFAGIVTTDAKATQATG